MTSSPIWSKPSPSWIEDTARRRPSESLVTDRDPYRKTALLAEWALRVGEFRPGESGSRAFVCAHTQSRDLAIVL